MKIKVIEDPGFQHDGAMYEAGNTYSNFPDDVGAAYCQAGMAENVDGDTETGVRDASKTITLDIQSGVVANKGVV